MSHDQWTDTLVRGHRRSARSAVNFFDGDAARSSRTTRDTTSVNIGAEHLFLREGSVIPLRLGFGWEPQGAMDPLVRDPVDLFLFAAGGGYNTNSLKFDAALQYRWGGYRRHGAAQRGPADRGAAAARRPGTRHTREWRVKVSVIYRLQDAAKLRGAFRRIFG